MIGSLISDVVRPAFFALLALVAVALPGESLATGFASDGICAVDHECRRECGREAWESARECRRTGHPPRACWLRAYALVQACIQSQCIDLPDCETRCAIFAADVEYRCLLAGDSVAECRTRSELARRACIEERCDTCEPVLCELFCEFGFETDDHGCEICQCREQPQCRSDRDCSPGEVCELSGARCDTPICVPGCHAGNQCGENQVCQEVQCVTCPCPGICTDLPPDPECRSDSDCSPGQVCEVGGNSCDTPICVDGCHTDGQCGPGRECQNVACVTCPCPGICGEGPPDPECRTDDDCGRGSVCELGGATCNTPVCVQGCHADAQCGADGTCLGVQCVTCPCPGLCEM